MFRTFLNQQRLLYFIGFFILLLAFFVDQFLLNRSSQFTPLWLNSLMLFITDFGLLYLLVTMIFWQYFSGRKRALFLLILTILFTVQLVMLFKFVFQTPRPFFAAEIVRAPLTRVSGFSFPSLHAAICFSILPIIFHDFQQRRLKYLYLFLLILIAYSRFYLGVHYLSDIIAGALIGLASAQLLVHLENRFQIYQRFIVHYHDHLELRRQLFHLAISLLIVFGLKIGLINWQVLAFITGIGGILILLQKQYPQRLISYFLNRFERPEHADFFPGKGAFFLFLGATLAAAIFPAEIALAAISIMGVGDSTSHLIGRYFGKTESSLTGAKKLEGNLVAALLATCTAIYFVDFWPALITSAILMTLEALYPAKIARYLDDNLLITLLAGILLQLF